MTTQNIHHFIPDLSRKSESVRMYAARMLGIESEEQIVPFLLDALQSTEPQVRLEAVRALGEMKDPAARDGLSAALGDDDEETRKGAAISLGQLNVPGGRACPGGSDFRPFGGGPCRCGAGIEPDGWLHVLAAYGR